MRLADRPAAEAGRLPWPPAHLAPGQPHLSRSWALTLLFGGLFFWWFLGLSGVVQFVFAVPLVISLAERGQVRMPRWFGLWLLFLAFMFASVVELLVFSSQDQTTNLLSWGWRMTLYVASTVLFLYVYSTPRELLPAKRLINILAGFWVLTVTGGLMAMALPNRTFNSLMEKVIPHHFLTNAFVKALVVPGTTGGKTFPGLGIYRVKAPFIYTNQWGSAFALTLPFAFAVVSETRNKLYRTVFLGLLVLGIVPLVFSLDRGSWLSSGVASVYGILRMAVAGKGRSRRMARAARSLLMAGVLVCAIVLVSPLGHDILTRTQNGYGDTHRTLLYSSSLILAVRSPVLGYASPVSLNVLDPTAPPGPSIGTHGTLWTVLVSNGMPAVAFFCLWFLYAAFKTYRRLPAVADVNGEAYFWSHVCIVAAIVQLPYYELLPWGLPIVMIAMALAFRERAYARRLPRGRTAPTGHPPAW